MTKKFKGKATYTTLTLLLLIISLTVIIFLPNKTQLKEKRELSYSLTEYLQEKGYTDKDIYEIDIDYHYYPQFEMPIAFVEFRDEVGIKYIYIYFEYEGVFKQQPMLETTAKYREKAGMVYTSELDESKLKHYEYNKTP